MTAFPALDPVAFSLGPLVIRWYALAYLAGFLLGWRTCLYLAKHNPAGPPPLAYDEFLTWAVLGTVLGGRIGYILFYQLNFYLEHPIEMVEVWHGGMSFHGGLIGVMTSAFIYCRVNKLPFFGFIDAVACVTPIGLGFGRVANFINGELFGRVADVPWAIVFPRGGDLPRHPSQLYEASLEGVVLFVVLFLLARLEIVRRHRGMLSGSFLFLYGLFRFICEFFREPDAQLGFLYAGATMGQLLCLPMMAAGILILVWSARTQGSSVTAAGAHVP